MKTLCIDLRWIDSSGVGVYIRGIMPGIVSLLDAVHVVGIGDRKRIAQFPWSRSANFSALSCTARRYSITEQIQLPSTIPFSTDLFFSPYYTIPLLYRGRIAVTVHDTSHLIVDEIVSNPVKHFYARTMYKALRKRASLVFTVSDFSRSELLRLTGESSQKVVTTHLGVSGDWFQARSLPRVYGRSYFVCVGNIKPYKNVRRLVDAFTSVKGSIPQDLVIVGQHADLITGESPEFFQRVRTGGSRIHLTGMVSHDELRSLVAHADALIMPSLYEGFGLPPLEAMSCGVPVAVSQAASLPEVCGDAALYFDPVSVDDIAAALLKLASSSKLREELAVKGLIRSRKFTWDACSETVATSLHAALYKD